MLHYKSLLVIHKIHLPEKYIKKFSRDMIIVWAINDSSWLDLQELNLIMSGQMSMFQ